MGGYLNEKWLQTSNRKTKGRDHLGSPSGRWEDNIKIMIKTLSEPYTSHLMGYIRLPGCCDHSNEPSGSHKMRKSWLAELLSASQRCLLIGLNCFDKSYYV